MFALLGDMVVVHSAPQQCFVCHLQYEKQGTSYMEVRAFKVCGRLIVYLHVTGSGAEKSSKNLGWQKLVNNLLIWSDSKGSGLCLERDRARESERAVPEVSVMFLCCQRRRGG